MSEEKKHYVLLTGGKNNAGDFLIKRRAKDLLNFYRKDRELIDFDGWKPFTKEQLTVINKAEALILTGGPSLQPGAKIEENIYPFIKNLDEVKVPIYTMGVGYKGSKGTWEENTNYHFSELSMNLLERVENSGGKSSVRDYHTLDVLEKKGYRNFLMTGCPALYETTKELKEIDSVDFKKVGFSLGVSYKLNNSMRTLMEDIILRTSDRFSDADFTVFFHHKINSQDTAQAKMIDFLKGRNIQFTDISGTAELLMGEYSKCDLHLGFRVHAHIFCSSMGIPSVLLSEDGRAIALKEVLNGLIFRAHDITGESFSAKALNRLKIKDRFVALKGVTDTVLNSIEYEIAHGSIRFNQAFKNISEHRKIMEEFIRDLP